MRNAFCSITVKLQYIFSKSRIIITFLMKCLLLLPSIYSLYLKLRVYPLCRKNTYFHGQEKIINNESLFWTSTVKVIWIFNAQKIINYDKNLWWISNSTYSKLHAVYLYHLQIKNAIVIYNLKITFESKVKKINEYTLRQLPKSIFPVFKKNVGNVCNESVKLYIIPLLLMSLWILENRVY